MMTTAATVQPTTTEARTLVSRNPATGEMVGEVPITPVEAIPTIVRRARDATKAWRGMTIDQRIALIEPAGKKLVERAEELGRLLTLEMGKPLAEAIGEVKGCGATMSASLKSIAEALEPEPLEDDSTASRMYFDPLGVAAVITPWNFPLAMPHWMVLPALAAGNTVIMKPSEETPLIAQAYAEILNESLPPDVLQIIHGADGQGKALVEAEVDLIAFTGSRETGSRIMQSAGGGLKRLVLELGGKDPLIVMEGADIEKAAEFAARNSFRNAGQVCVSTERIYVDDRIADQFQEAFVRHTREMKVGSGLEEETRIGPMISARQRDHVLGQLKDAVNRGAKVLYGGEGHHDQFVMPTILTEVNHTMPIMRDETFGPVACVARYTNADEAVELANDTPFGLGAVVFGPDDQAERIARQLDAGMVGINKSCGGASGSPWVGAKQSGFGYHSGKAGHRQFTQTRIVSRPRG